jgi:hypothetical protein
MGAKHEDEKLLGQLPGTGGDFIDTTDVEGHVANRGEGEGVVKRGVPGPGEGVVSKGPEPEGDVEGHRLIRMADGSEDLYRGGPTTQGEIVTRGPGENPHGER